VSRGARAGALKRSQALVIRRTPGLRFPAPVQRYADDPVQLGQFIGLGQHVHAVVGLQLGEGGRIGTDITGQNDNRNFRVHLSHHSKDAWATSGKDHVEYYDIDFRVSSAEFAHGAGVTSSCPCTPLPEQRSTSVDQSDQRPLSLLSGRRNKTPSYSSPATIARCPPGPTRAVRRSARL
jgi:hypothetical protein